MRPSRVVLGHELPAGEDRVLPGERHERLPGEDDLAAPCRGTGPPRRRPSPAAVGGPRCGRRVRGRGRPRLRRGRSTRRPGPAGHQPGPALDVTRLGPGSAAKRRPGEPVARPGHHDRVVAADDAVRARPSGPVGRGDVASPRASTHARPRPTRSRAPRVAAAPAGPRRRVSAHAIGRGEGHATSSRGRPRRRSRGGSPSASASPEAARSAAPEGAEAERSSNADLRWHLLGLHAAFRERTQRPSRRLMHHDAERRPHSASKSF